MEKCICHFCGKPAKRVKKIGIAFGMGGDDYSFCYKCLKGMSADFFWRKMFQGEGFIYPPKPKSNQG